MEDTYTSSASAQPEVSQERPPMPDSYLVWAILTTIFCCLPFGIVSIVYSTKVEPAYLTGHYDLAIAHSAAAKRWAIVSAAIGVGSVLLYCIFFVLTFVLGFWADNF